MIRKTQNVEDFQYWKNSWGQWITLIAAVLQIILLWMNFSDWRNISHVASEIFSPTAWDDYTNHVFLQCAFNALGAVAFTGCFLIGVCAKKKRTARLLEAILLLFIAVSWGTAGMFFSSDSNKFWWILVFLIAVVGSVVSFLRTRNKQVSP